MPTVRASIVVSVLFTLFGGPGMTLVLGPWLITRFRMPSGEPIALVVVSYALVALGLIPLLDSIVRFIVAGRGTLVPTVPTEHLVVTGLYRYVRNPMYTGVVIAIVGETLLFRSWSMLVYAALVWLAMHLFVCFYEERRLFRTYGQKYARFKQNVPRWIPRLSPWRGEGSTAADA